MSTQKNNLSKTVLVVDDVPANLSLLLNHLRALDYHVLVAESGMSALEQMQHIRPDIILLDVMMPGVDGYETCQLIKANELTKEIPVIFVTALTESADRLRGFEVGGVDFVSKPIEITEVAARINTHIMLNDLQRELAKKNLELKTSLRSTDIALNTEMQLRRQSQTDKEMLVELAMHQGEQLKLIMRSVFEQGTDKSDVWQLLFRPILADLARGQSIVGKMNDQLLNNQTMSLLDIQTMIDEMHSACESVESGLYALAPKLSKLAIDQDKLNQISDRELEILKCLANGQTNEEIALDLNLASATVRTYRIRIMRKLGIHDVAGLVKFALRHGLTSID